MADPREWILLNPGPANTTPSVRRALVTPDLCHREPEFFEVMRECRARLARLAGGGSDWSTVLIAGSGTAAVEAAIASAPPAGGALLVVVNGVYGDRMLRMARAHGIAAEALTYDIFTPAVPADVARALAAHPEISHVALVHHETTSGLLNPVAEVAAVAARHGRRVIVDAMSSLFGEPFDLDLPALDFVTASANKCLQGIPGVAFVLARRTALDALKGRPPRSVYLDLHNHWVQQEADNTPFTPAVQVLHAMRQALLELEAETVARRIARYAENARVLREGMARLGFESLVPPPARSSILTTLRLPAGVTYGLHHLRRAGGPAHLRLPRLQHGHAHPGRHGRCRRSLRRQPERGRLVPGEVQVLDEEAVGVSRSATAPPGRSECLGGMGGHFGAPHSTRRAPPAAR
ncbi:MAG: aminotransferase class V-fold PLP-dependent enzyme [Candidatus Rokubacteria bacterium]|nr:aminotransferase class V-fold PLP-dependent enzyme [Candidatus Rokubacteria bacterium]